MKIFIVPYQPAWPGLFLSEQMSLDSVLKDFYPIIEHIGSTSVVGLGAKPIIDILVGIKDTEDLDKTIKPMIRKGYSYIKKYEPLWPGRRFFVKSKSSVKILPDVIDTNDEFIVGAASDISAHIHIILKDSHDWRRHIAFRDFLRAHAHTRDEYYNFKEMLSKRDFKDPNEYNNAKAGFIHEIERLSLNWFKNKNENENTI